MSEPSPEPVAERPRARRWFGPCVLFGLIGAGLLAYAGSQTWVDTGGATGPVAGIDSSGMASTSDVGQSPLAGALGLVALACWGVFLVTRRWFRRAVALLGAVSAAGAVVVAIVASRSLPASVAEDLAATGVEADTSLTHWVAFAAAGATLSALMSVLAVLWAPSWPEMGSRYDAPGSASATKAAQPAEDRSSLDLWKAIDEGDDPTR